MQPAGVLRGVNPSEVEQPTRFEIRTFLLHMSVRGTSPMYEMATVFVSSRGSVDILREIQRLNGKPIFRLTRVTRIFEKSVFTETTPEARAACRAGFFVARSRAAGFACLQKNREIQEITAMQFQRGQSGNPSGRPRGALNRATVVAQELLAARVESIAAKLI